MVFVTCLVCCVFAQGFSLKVSLLDQNIKKGFCFLRVLNLKVLQTLILDTFAGEQSVKPTDFQLCVVFCVFAQGFSLKVAFVYDFDEMNRIEQIELMNRVNEALKEALQRILTKNPHKETLQEAFKISSLILTF